MPRSAEQTNDDERSNSGRGTDNEGAPPAAAAPPRRPNYVLRIEENDGKSLTVMERWWLAVEQQAEITKPLHCDAMVKTTAACITC